MLCDYTRYHFIFISSVPVKYYIYKYIFKDSSTLRYLIYVFASCNLYICLLLLYAIKVCQLYKVSCTAKNAYNTPDIFENIAYCSRIPLFYILIIHCIGNEITHDKHKIWIRNAVWKIICAAWNANKRITTVHCQGNNWKQLSNSNNSFYFPFSRNVPLYYNIILLLQKWKWMGGISIQNIMIFLFTDKEHEWMSVIIMSESRVEIFWILGFSCDYFLLCCVRIYVALCQRS